MWTLLVLCSVIASHGVQGQTFTPESTWMTATTAAETETATTTAVSKAPCGGYLYGTRGYFYSPNYPEKYPYNANCEWYIRPGSRIIELEFSYVNVEPDYNCRFDAIYVYDGPSTYDRFLGKLCGGQRSTFHSTGYYLTVRFKSDNSSNYNGFRAEYSVVREGSCRYNCGFQVGGCSCANDCEYRGNCCPDYKGYCQISTVPPATTPPQTTAQLSCRYNCGSHLGSCSCSSSCQYYGNCCYDYIYQCRWNSTTSAPVQNTTVRASCRYNCGRHMGSCSCSSSCRYYGNCCYDYYSYCEATSAYPTAPPSCRYNCGRHMGSCSCASSCQYNYNCCHDFYSYCPATTPSTANPCGGSMHGSGSFSSPYYPKYYHDNSYCVWYLRAQSNERISLSITDLQLENCCNCDYIAVYDGPSLGSRMLGKVCENSTVDFLHSSSNYMTVLFRSDGSVVGRGFTAKFTSSLPPSSGRVDCSSDNMNIIISRSYLSSMGYDGEDLYLNDQYCRPRITSYQVIFSFPVNTCGTIRRFENGRIVYTNALRAHASRYGEITRQSHFKLHVDCRMEPDTTAQIMYIARDFNTSDVTGTGRFNASMAFYTSSSFYYKITEVPYKVTLNQNLYIEVRLRRDDSSLVLFLDTCVASPSPHDFHTRTYDLVRNGCRRDSTYHAYTSGSSYKAQFTFRAFQFLRTHESVYLQCKILICPASDYNSRCRRGCYNRKARDLGSAHESQSLVLGPIQLKDFEKQDEGAQKEEKA